MADCGKSFGSTLGQACDILCAFLGSGGAGSRLMPGHTINNPIKSGRLLACSSAPNCVVGPKTNSAHTLFKKLY